MNDSENGRQMDTTERYFVDRAGDWVDDAYNESNGLVPLGVQRIQVVESILRKYGVGAGMSVCDLGCGDGSLCREMSALGMAVTGLDRSDAMVTLARERSAGDETDYVQSSIEDAVGAVGGRRFDVVTSMGVMYYLPEDGDLLDRIKTLLEPGGLAVVSCRNRLFNLFSGSRKRPAELDSDDRSQLLEELVSLDTNLGVEDLHEFLRRLHGLTSPEVLAALPTPDNDKERELEEVIQTVEGRQHLPSEIRRSAAASGLAVKAIYGVQPHFLAAGASDERAAQLLRKVSEALMSLNHLPISLIWSSHFIVEMTHAES